VAPVIGFRLDHTNRFRGNEKDIVSWTDIGLVLANGDPKPFARKEKSLPSPRMKVSMKGDVATISPDHPDAGIGHLLLMKALGTTESDFIDGLLAQLANAATKGRAVDDRGLNFLLAVVKGIEPTDQVEAMLAA
jgi:hypothetical protein